MIKITGYNGTLILNEDNLIIQRGLRGFLLGGLHLRGDKNIPYSRISAVQYKKPGIMLGYIQFSIMGGDEAKGGFFQSVEDENTINFTHRKNAEFQKAREYIEKKMVEK